MFLKLNSCITAFALVAGAAAVCNTTDATVDPNVMLLAYKEHFRNAGIVPSLIETFDPTAIMALFFDTVGYICPGESLTVLQAKSAPSLSLIIPNNSVTLGNAFTVVMLDAGVPGTDLSSHCTVRHWLVNDVTLEKSESFLRSNLSLDSGEIITEYFSPRPMSGSGPHRYAVLLYDQPEGFTQPAELSQPNMGASMFCLDDYVTKSGLGGIVAGIYFTVEEGVATFTPSETTPVVSSTLTETPTSTPDASIDFVSSSQLGSRPAALGLFVVLFSMLLLC